MGVRTAEDLVHETLVIIFEKYKDIEFDRGVLPWAYGILDKVMSGDYRRKIRRQNIMTENIAEVIKLHDDNESVEDELMSLELINEIQQALDHLNHKEKEIFALKLDGLSGEEIQDRLGVSRTTLDVSVFRGRRKLKKRLQKRGVI